MKLCIRSLAFTLVLATPVLCQASSDLCLFNSGNVESLVFRSFKMPKAGQCRPVAGNAPTLNYVVSGSACVSSDATELTIYWSGINDADDKFMEKLLMPLPSLAGGTRITSANFAVNSSSSAGWHANSCKGEPVP